MELIYYIALHLCTIKVALMLHSNLEDVFKIGHRHDNNTIEDCHQRSPAHTNFSENKGKMNPSNGFEMLLCKATI